MTRFSLDPDTADRLLTGNVAPEDAPQGYAEVARQFQAVTRRPTAAVAAGEQAAVAAMVEGIRATEPTSRPVARRKSVLTKAKLAAAGLAGALTLTTGLAAANALPGAAQQTAADALAKVGVSVPSPNSHSNGHPDTRGKSATHDTSSTPSGNGPNAHADFGLCTATEAHQGDGAQPKSTVFPSATTCSTVVHPGQGSPPDTAASGDNAKPANPGSQGQENKPAATPAGPPSSTPASGTAPVGTPNGGGTSTANTASDGHSSTGTANADQHSNGAASAGSDNGASHRP